MSDTSPQGTLPTRLAFISVAVWWVIFSIPLFRHVPEPRIAWKRACDGVSDPGGVREAVGNGPRASRPRQAFLMLLAFLIYNDGIGTIIRMASIYATELKIDQSVVDRLDHDRAVCGHSVCVPLRHAGRIESVPSARSASGCSRTWRFAFSVIS